MTDTTEALPAKWRVVLGILAAPAITALVTGALAVAGTLYATKAPQKPAQAVAVVPAPTPPPQCDLAALREDMARAINHAMMAEGYSRATWDKLQITGSDHRNNRTTQKPAPPVVKSMAAPN